MTTSKVQEFRDKQKRLLPTTYGAFLTSIIADRTINKNARIVYGLIRSKQGHSKYAKLSTKDVMTTLGWSNELKVKRAIKVLKDSKIVTAPKRGLLACKVIRMDGKDGQWGAAELKIFEDTTLSDDAKLLYMQYAGTMNIKEGYSHLPVEKILKKMKVNRNNYNEARLNLQNRGWIIVHYGNNMNDSDYNFANRVFVKNSKEAPVIIKHQKLKKFGTFCTEAEIAEQNAIMKAKNAEGIKRDAVESIKRDTPINNLKGTERVTVDEIKEEKIKCYATTTNPSDLAGRVQLDPVVIDKRIAYNKMAEIRSVFNRINFHTNGRSWISPDVEYYFNEIVDAYPMEDILDMIDDRFNGRAVDESMGFNYIFKPEIIKLDNGYTL